VHDGCENKEKIKITSQDLFFEGWSIKGHITKVVEWIVMDFGH